MFGGPWEIVIVLLVVMLFFGKKLPGAAKSLGQSFVAFKKGIKDGAEEELPENSGETNA